jgi:hypothetical protein
MNILKRLSHRKSLKKSGARAPVLLAFAAGLGILALAVASEALQRKSQPSPVIISPYLPTIVNPGAEPEPQPPTF